jgi:hypothetical protein
MKTTAIIFLVIGILNLVTSLARAANGGDANFLFPIPIGIAIVLFIIDNNRKKKGKQRKKFIDANEVE